MYGAKPCRLFWKDLWSFSKFLISLRLGSVYPNKIPKMTPRSSSRVVGSLISYKVLECSFVNPSDI